MSILILIVIANIAIAFMVFFYFKNKNHKIIKAHSDLIGYYNECIALHQQVSADRDNGLDRYSFIRYNLKESLLV